MRPICTTILFIFLFNHSFAQNLHVVVNAGVSNYLGDLASKYIDFKQTKPSSGIGLQYEISDKIIARAIFSYGKIEGNDAYSSKSDILQRNLNFQSSIQEFAIAGEYQLLSLYENRFTPYAFVGIAIFHFNPYTYDVNKQKVYLHPLNTEGQGFSQYPTRKKYALIQPSIPFGGGIKFALTDNIRFGFELGLRKLFTDYLDDVSATYIDETILLNAKGPRAVELAYRSDEMPGGSLLYPADGTERGNSKQKDLYSFNGISIAIRFGSNSMISQKNSFRKLKLGCPAVNF